MGPFWEPFGRSLAVRSALRRKCLRKKGWLIWCHRFLLIFEKKKGIFGTRKREPNHSQDGTEKGRKKGHLKKYDFHIFFNKFTENAVFYNRKWASRADSIVFYNEFARPKGQENRGQCGQNLRKTMIFVFFLVLAWERRCGDFGRSKAPTWGRKSGSEAMKIGC